MVKKIRCDQKLEGLGTVQEAESERTWSEWFWGQIVNDCRG